MTNSNTSSSTEAPAVEASPVCPICGGAGFLRQNLPVEHPDFGKLIPCQCRLEQVKTKKLQRLRSISNLEALGHYTFDTFTPAVPGVDFMRQNTLNTAYNAARSFAENPQGWRVFLGGYGCGKTHLAVAIANYRVAQNKPALFVVVPDLLDNLRAAYGPHSGSTYDERFDQIRNAPLLILDDLGTQSSTPWAQEKLFQIFNHRYNARLPTVITSNHKLEEIDRRIRSRLVDPDLSQVINITAPDFRGGGESTIELSSLAYHHDKTFETFDLRARSLDRNQAANLQRAFSLARNYAQDPSDWILLTGSYGCGKTHLAAAIANERAQQGQAAIFIVVPDLLDHLRATFSPAAQTSYDKRFEEIRNAPLLVLDDLGTQSATPWAQEKLYQLFNHRYNARLPTVITMADMTDLDPRLKSRLMDVGRCTAFAITAPSYRSSVSQQSQKRKKPTRRRKSNY